MLKASFLVLYFLISITVYGQSNVRQERNLISYPLSNSIVYEIDSVKFYVGKAVAIAFLKKELKDRTNKSDSVLLKTLKETNNPALNLKCTSFIFNNVTHQIDMSLAQNNYVIAMNKIVARLLIEGDISVYDFKSKAFINKIIIVKSGDGDFIGWFVRVKFCYTNGQEFYGYQFRNIKGDEAYLN